MPFIRPLLRLPQNNILNTPIKFNFAPLAPKNKIK